MKTDAHKLLATSRQAETKYKLIGQTRELTHFQTHFRRADDRPSFDDGK